MRVKKSVSNRTFLLLMDVDDMWDSTTRDFLIEQRNYIAGVEGLSAYNQRSAERHMRKFKEWKKNLKRR